MDIIIREVSNMKLKRILTAAIVVVMTLGMFSLNTANAAGTYSISCKNDAYGMQLGSDYTQVAYAYAGLTAGQATNIHNDYLIQGTVGAYVVMIAYILVQVIPMELQ
jgi:hypothetical protein